HFLRGVVSELVHRGHTVEVYEPANGWSSSNLRAERGPAAIDEFHSAFPELSSRYYDAATLDLDAVLDGADVAIVHEWNEPELIARIGEYSARVGCKALFHDTHHRSVTDVETMASLDLRHYHGVLAFGRTVAERYHQHG